MTSLHNKIVAVTGGGSGIGLAIAQVLAEQGAQVAIGGRRVELLQTAAADCNAPTPVRYRHLDVADRDNVDAFFDWMATEIGSVDILVNSAGSNITDRSMADMEPADWDRLMAINATGAYNTMRAVLPSMKERRDGVIVNISSIAGKRATPLGGIAYNASKFAMSALGMGVGNEVAADGVRVTNVCPGEVNTPILDKRPVALSDEHRQAIVQPADIAALVLAIVQLPPRAHVPEIIIKPLKQPYA